MSRLRVLGCAVTFFALILLLGRGLVAGPDSQVTDGPADCGGASFVARLPQTETDTAQDTVRSQDPRTEGRTPERDAVLPTLCLSDRNGTPLTGRTWHSTVYLVCPPEGVPG